MSDFVFSKLTSFSTIDFVSSGVDTESYRVTSGVANSLQQIALSIENQNYENGFMQLHVYDESDELVGVGYIEDWRPMCFPEDVVGSPDSRDAHMSEVKDKRLETLEEETAFDASWSVLLDNHDVLSGSGEYGQTQFFAVKPTVIGEE